MWKAHLMQSHADPKSCQKKLSYVRIRHPLAPPLIHPLACVSAEHMAKVGLREFLLDKPS